MKFIVVATSKKLQSKIICTVHHPQSPHTVSHCKGKKSLSKILLVGMGIPCLCNGNKGIVAAWIFGLCCLFAQLWRWRRQWENGIQLYLAYATATWGWYHSESVIPCLWLRQWWQRVRERPNQWCGKGWQDYFGGASSREGCGEWIFILFIVVVVGSSGVGLYEGYNGNSADWHTLFVQWQ